MTEPLDPPTPRRADPRRDVHLDRRRATARTSQSRRAATPAPTGHGRHRELGEHAATAILESLREAVDDLAERASPTVREFSARAAELAAVAADRAAPLAKRAGEATSDASGKLAEQVARSGPSDLRASAAPDARPAAPRPRDGTGHARRRRRDAAAGTPDADAPDRRPEPGADRPLAILRA